LLSDAHYTYRTTPNRPGRTWRLYVTSDFQFVKLSETTNHVGSVKKFLTDLHHPLRRAAFLVPSLPATAASARIHQEIP
jgi:hypothetical protein